MSVAPLFCANCGAANEPPAAACFACGQSLSLPQAAVSGTASARMVQQRYRIVRQVGTGGFGAVYLAEDTKLQDYPVALKEIRLAGLKPQEMIEATDAFNREVTLLSGLRHPHLPRVFDHFTDPQHWYLIMDFIEGETLENYVQKRAAGRFPVETVLEMGIQLATVLDYLHTRQPPIIFRDLKPSNIMRTPQGNLYLIDFGIARIFKPGQARDTIAFGSPGYAPPEQYGKAQTTARADLYSLGATLHALLTGDDPANNAFHFAPLALSSSDTLSSLERLIMQMVELDASKRPASAATVKQELRAIVEQLAQEQKWALFQLPTSVPPSSFTPLYIPPAPVPSGPPTLATGAGQVQVQIGKGTAHRSRRQHNQRQQATTAAAAVPKQGIISRRRVLIGIGALVALSAGLTSLKLGQPFGLYVYQGHENTVSDIVWSPDNSRIASSSWDTTVQVWDAHSGGDVFTYRGHHDAVWAVDWMPRGHLIASGDSDHSVQVWYAWSGERFNTYNGHAGGIEALRWSPNSRQIASASDDTSVHIWDAFSGITSIFYQNHTDKVMDVAWSPNGSLIASCGEDGTAQVWEASDGTLLRTYNGHLGAVNAVVWSPDGTQIASAGDDGTVQVWNALTGTRITIYDASAGEAWGISWTADLQRIASAYADGTVHIWNASTGQLIQKYTSGARWVCNIAWSADNQYLAFTKADNTVDVWQPDV